MCFLEWPNIYGYNCSISQYIMKLLNVYIIYLWWHLFMPSLSHSFRKSYLICSASPSRITNFDNNPSIESISYSQVYSESDFSNSSGKVWKILWYMYYHSIIACIVGNGYFERSGAISWHLWKYCTRQKIGPFDLIK